MPALARPQAHGRCGSAGGAERREEHTPLRDLCRPAEDRRLPLHDARAAPGRGGPAGPSQFRRRGHPGHHRGRPRRQRPGHQVPAAHRAHSAPGGTRARGQPRSTGDLRSPVARNRSVLGGSRGQAACRGAHEARSSARAPLLATLDSHPARRAGRRRFIRDPRRALETLGNPVAGALGRSRDEVAAYLALAQVPGIGSGRLRTLVAAFETATAALRAPHGAIDAVARAAALGAGGASIGVLGNGFGVIYPAANRPLYDRMRAGGCLVTELCPGERPHAGAFPRRNRLISGLAGVTVVVEAAPGSGALITTDCALDQGRAVLAVPGPITSPTSLGCNRLIQQGAKPALTPGDILEELGMPGAVQASAERPAVGESPAERPPPPGLSGLQRSLWETLRTEPKHVDALVATAGMDTSAVLTALTELEIRGVVKQQPGMLFGLA